MDDQDTTAGQESQQTTATTTAPSNDATTGVTDTGTTTTSADTGGTVDGGGTTTTTTDTTAADDGDKGELQRFREQLAGGDAGLLKSLERYKSVGAISNAFKEARTAAKGAGKVPALSDKSSPEEVKAFRAANGIPDDAKAYPGDFREGFKATDADKAILGEFKEAMHGKNVPPAFAAAALDWYQDFAVAQQQQLDGNMAKIAKETQAALRTEWGGEYDGNLNAASELMKSHLGDEGFERMMGLRMTDGSRLQDDPAFVKMMAQIGSDYYGGNAIMTGDIETTAKSVQEQIDDLLKLRNEDPTKYFSDDVQSKITKLYQQREKINERKK